MQLNCKAWRVGAGAIALFTTHTLAGTVSGPLVQWQALSIDYAGPISGEFADPNPFLDYRLQVEFSGPSGQSYSVPGYFAGDGAGGATGNIWRVKFNPDEPGQWTAAASFRGGTDVAVAALADETPDPSAGTPSSFDGDVDVFTVAPVDSSAPGFASKGRLAFNNTHYLTFPDGTAFLKAGADSPENWLGYVGFDNTTDFGAGPSTPSGLHEFPTHVADWNPGDPDWDSPDTADPNDGRAIIGALNYLASVGINNIYFLPMNIGGDGKDSWPYADPGINGNGAAGNDNTRFDISKLEQWEIFFQHAQDKGVFLQWVMNEAETPNKQELDNATLGTERRLFYREMSARFAHHNAMNWNVSEEYNLNLNLGVNTVLGFARAIKGQDPYDHPVTVHNAGNPFNPNSGPWASFIGQPDIDLTSLQRARQADGWGQVVADYRAASTNAGKPIPIMIDEPASPTRDVANFDDFRKRVIWDILISGGGGEWFINNRDQSLEDFREFDKIWRETTIARRFIEDNMPFAEMTPDRGLVTGETSTWDGAEVFKKAGEVYAIYYPVASNTGTLDLTEAPGTFRLQWFNPRTGAFQGTPATVVGGGPVLMPPPPADTSEDWAALLTLGDGELNVLFIRGADRSGGFLEAGNDFGRTEQLADITNTSTSGGNHGWFELAETLRAEGFTVDQMIEPLEPGAPGTGQTTGAPIDFDQMDLSDVEVIVFGSNNAVYTVDQINAIDQYIRNGGAALFIADANFGSDWADSSSSDQQFLDRFGWIAQQDQGTYVLRREDGDFVAPDHPILNNINAIDGEGVSPIVVPASDIFGIATTQVVRAKPGAQTRNNDGNPGSSRPVGPSDSTLAVASVVSGRIAGHVDRNTFFNLNGAGTNINRFDNQQYAINLFRWLAGLPVDPDTPDPIDDCNDNGLDDAIETGATEGLVGTYFDGLDFTGERRARIDATVDFDYGAGAPFPDWDGDTFSTRWTGYVRTTVAGTYTLGTITNDGARLFVNGVQLVDQWMDMSPTLHTGTIDLPADALVPVRMEHYEGQNTAVARLVWAPPGTGSTVAIPTANLVPSLDADASGLPDECEQCNAADLVPPFGILDLGDVDAFIADFLAGGIIADLAAPQGTLDLSDVDAFIADFGAGCP
ncbi:MAG: PA14 domain-containing protein [Planctomycetota bacterium]